MRKFLPLNGAISIIKKESRLDSIITTSQVKLTNSLGRITSRDYYADSDFPPFNKSAMDGYVVSNPDALQYEIVGMVKAGEYSQIELKSDQCLAIMTGAPINKNGTKVIINEDVDVVGNKIVVKKRSNNTNIVYKGEDLKSGDISLNKGSIITHFSLGSLANSGVNKVDVYEKIGVSIAVTGDELIGIDKKPKDGFIRDINGSTLFSRVNAMPFCRVDTLKMVKDSLIDTKRSIDKFLSSKSSLLILSGGSSRGEYDFVVKALEDLGIDIFIEGVRIQPGKPVIFAKHKDKLIFGLPGNPVSVLIAFEVFVKEALYRLVGNDYNPTIFKGVLADNFKRRNSERTLFFPVSLTNENGINYITPVRYNGSGHITSYNGVSYFGVIGEGETEFRNGDEIFVRQVWQNY